MLNDGVLEANNVELYPLYIALAEGILSEKYFAAWLRQRTGLKPGKRVQEPRTKRYRAHA